MSPSVGKKLAFFVAFVVLLTVGAMGFVSYRLMEAKFAEILRKDTLDAATLLSSRVRNELRHVAEKGRILAAAALEDFKSPDDQLRFLEDNLEMDDQLIALSLFRKGEKLGQPGWNPVFRLVRPEGDPSYLNDADFKQLDLKYPLDLGLVAEGAVEISVGALKDGTPILRLAVPIVRKKGGAFTQLLQLEVRQERITAAFAESTAHFSFILDRNGRVLTQTDPTHFTFGEDLSHLPILQMARTTEAPNGNLDYYELPGGPLQYAAFHKVGYADLTVVTQAPRTHVIHMLRSYTRQGLFLGVACVLLAMAFTLIAAWGIIGARLGRLAATLSRTGEGRFAVQFPDSGSEDEIGSFSRRLQAIFDELKERERVHGTFAKLRNRRVKQAIHDHKVTLTGERLKAIVLSLHLRGIEDAAGKAEPEVFLKLVNRFAQSATELIEARQGIVDHIHGGSVVATWGIPITDPQDAENAMQACLELRKLAKSFNDQLKKAKLPPVALGIGVHYGPVVAGQLGSDDRLEYSAIGEAIELSWHALSLTDQYGTDCLLTGPAASIAPEWFSTEKATAHDAQGTELFELLGTVARKAASSPAVNADGTPVKRKRGRPRKVRPGEGAVAAGIVAAGAVAVAEAEPESVAETEPVTETESVAEAEAVTETEIEPDLQDVEPALVEDSTGESTDPAPGEPNDLSQDEMAEAERIAAEMNDEIGEDPAAEGEPVAEGEEPATGEENEAA
jgi:adenylate cyclase